MSLGSSITASLPPSGLEDGFDYHIINCATLHRKFESQNVDELHFTQTDFEVCVDYQVDGDSYTRHLGLALIMVDILTRVLETSRGQGC